MSERPNLNEERVLSLTASQFVTTLRALKSEGFSDWLFNVYGGRQPSFKLGAFYYDEPREFADEFADAYFEFEAADRLIAREGVALALKLLHKTKTKLHPLSIYALSKLTSTTRCYFAVPYFTKFLRRSNPHYHDPLTGIVLFRDTLENLLNIAFAWIVIANESQLRVTRRDNKREQNIFKELAGFCYEILIDGSSQREKDTIPAYAPLYFYSLFHVFAFLRDGNERVYVRKLEDILLHDFPRYKQWASALAIYTSKRFPDKRGTYNIDAIMDTYRDFINALVLTPIVSEVPAVDLGKPITRASTTEGGYVNVPREVEPDELLAAIEC